MTATIYSKVKGFFSTIDTEETVYHVEKMRDGKGIRVIIQSMKEPYKTGCRFDTETGDSFYVERNTEDIDNGVYTVNHNLYRAESDTRKMDYKSLVKMLENWDK